MPVKISPASKPGFNSGFTMIELLVAVVVLAIGLLGMAGLQTAGLSNNQSAYFRSQATIAIADIIDRMRANKPGVDNGSYRNFVTSGALPDDPNCITSADGCTAAQLVDHDKREWTKFFNVVDNSTPLLPNATGRISFDNATNLYTVSVSWDEMDSWKSDKTRETSNKNLSVNVSL